MSSERTTIAGVIYNRLESNNFPYLQIDASILYVTGHKEALTAEDLLMDTPYNLYTNSGLPPAPITNPGLNSIGAALSPEDTDYYFFILDREAHEHRFSKTHAEHTQLENELGYND